MNSSKVVALLFSAFLVLVAAQSPFRAHAGGMKDVQISHLEALAQHLYGTFDTDLLEFRNTVFVPAPVGFFIAVQSEVSVESEVTGMFEWQKCTTYFVKASTASDSLVVTKVSCTL